MYICHACHESSAVKLGKCPACGDFGTFIKDPQAIGKINSKEATEGVTLLQDMRTVRVFPISQPELQRIYTKGIQSGGMYLIGGEPGIGKSTIVIQVIYELLQLSSDMRVGYFSGEENSDQVLERIQRIQGSSSPTIDVYHTTTLEDILQTTDAISYDLIVIDSIQTVTSAMANNSAGSSQQVRYCSEKLSDYCKSHRVACIVIGHVTKVGDIAGPKYLEHIVDVVTYIEGDRYGQYRFLRNQKNRFGTADDVAIFEMTAAGLVPATQLSDVMIGLINRTTPGNVLTIGIDNGRPITIGVEVLINKTKMNYPKRICSGVSTNRLDIIVAVIEKYLPIDLGYHDIFINIPGEFKFNDSGLDLAMAVGIISQYKQIVLDPSTIWLGELGLGGQILPSKLHTKRSKEILGTQKLMDYQCIISIQNIVLS